MTYLPHGRVLVAGGLAEVAGNESVVSVAESVGFACSVPTTTSTTSTTEPSTTTTSTTEPSTTTTTTLPPDSTCTSKKLSLIAKNALAEAKCHSRAIGKGIALDPGCLPKADANFSEGWVKAEGEGDCLAPPGDETAIADQVDAFLDGVVTDLVNTPGPSKCTAKKLTLAGKKASARLVCHNKAVRKGVVVTAECLQKATDKFTIGWTTAEKAADCQAGTGDVALIENKVDSFVDGVANDLQP